MASLEDGVTKGHSLTAVLPIVATAFLLRLFFVILNYKGLPASDHFERFGAEMGWTARSIATGHGYSSPFFPQTGPTALVCPVFPTVLAGIFRVFGVYTNAAALAALGLNSILSSLTAAVIFFGLRKRVGVREAKTAAWIWALYPYAIYYSATYLWDCALTSLLFSCCFFLAVTRLPQMRPRGWAGYGALYAVTALCNPSILTMAPVLLGYAAWQRWRLRGRIVRRLIFAVAAMALTLAPWTVRNLMVLHQPVLMRDGFWGEFYAGNNGDTSQSNPGWTHPASNPAEMRRYQQLGETGYMKEKRRLSMAYVHAHPLAFAEVSMRRVLRFWTGYWSFSRAYLEDESLDMPNVPFCIALTTLMVVGAWQFYRRQRRTALPYIAAFVLFPLPYYVTHASIDYRQPIEPLVVACVAHGALALVRKRRQAQHEAALPLTQAA